MRIAELDWIMEHWEKLSEFEQRWLEQYNLKEQYEQGELSMKYSKMMQLFKLLDNIYHRYNPRESE